MCCAVYDPENMMLVGEEPDTKGPGLCLQEGMGFPLGARKILWNSTGGGGGLHITVNVLNAMKCFTLKWLTSHSVNSTSKKQTMIEIQPNAYMYQNANKAGHGGSRL